MKRAFRSGWRILAVVTGLVVASILVCLDGVDSRPYFREPYYSETAARLRANAETNKAVFGELAAGIGRARLSAVVNAPEDAPDVGRFRSVPLAGYGGRRGKPATGIHDDLFVKAVALKVGGRIAVVVGADALIIPPEVAEKAAGRLVREAGLAREQIYLGATHTHSSLGGWGRGLVAESFAGGFQAGVLTWFADCIVGAVREALGDLKPARFGHGSFAAPQFIRNRLVGALGRVDPEFTYAVVRQETGRMAVVGVYGAHATVLSSDNLQLSGDYPGYWARAVEEATDGMAVFLAGGVGSQSPVPGGRGFAGAEQMGQGLARLLMEQVPRTPLTNRVTFGVMGVNARLPPFNVRVSDGIRLRPWLARKLLPPADQAVVQVLRVGDLVWVSAPCDFSGELALEMKDFLRARGAAGVVTSFNGDYVGYVIPSRYYHASGYEPRLMSFYGPNVPDYFEELMRSMAVALMKD